MTDIIPPDETDGKIGDVIKAHRKSRGLSLQAAADRTGLSVSMISKIERNLTSPSVRSLYALSRGLGIQLGSIFSGLDEIGKHTATHDTAASEAEARMVVRKANRRFLDFGEKRLVKELLTPQPIGELELLMVVLAPGGSTGEDVFSHAGEEGGLVITGALELWIDDTRLLLYPGDSFTFESRKPHWFRNAADEETQVLWINTPPVF
ncbi:MAG: helix-turn-helix domain-containing protein [Pseudomonadota bacterium]